MPAFAQVLGVEALITKDVRRTHALLYEHLSTIRAHPAFKAALFVLSFESNLGCVVSCFEPLLTQYRIPSIHTIWIAVCRFESQHLLHYLHGQKLDKWVSMSEGAGGSHGWLTTGARKEAMALSLREAIRIGRISFSKFFFSISMETAATAKQRILDEMLNFSVVTEAPKNAFGKVFHAMK